VHGLLVLLKLVAESCAGCAILSSDW